MIIENYIDPIWTKALRLDSNSSKLSSNLLTEEVGRMGTVTSPAVK